MSSSDVKPYSTECTGPALQTVKERSEAQDLTLFGACYCPFVQRAWVAFEALEIPYQYYESDPYKRPKDLMEVSPKGFVPGLRFNRSKPAKALHESIVIMEYLEDLAQATNKRTLLPLSQFPYSRGLVRLQSSHVSDSLVASWYRYLRAQEPAQQEQQRLEYLKSIKVLIDLFERGTQEVLDLANGASGEGEIAAAKKGLGLWIEGNEELGWTDIVVGPWIQRSLNVLAQYRGFSFSDIPDITPDLQAKWDQYVAKLVEHQAFKKTCSNDDVYIDTYQAYAVNKPHTAVTTTN